MPDINRSRILQLQLLRNQRREPNNIRQLFPEYRHSCHSNLGLIANFLKVYGYPYEAPDERHAGIDTVLDSVVVRCYAVHEEEGYLCEAYAHICADCCSLCPEIFAYKIGVVAV